MNVQKTPRTDYHTRQARNFHEHDLVVPYDFSVVVERQLLAERDRNRALQDRCEALMSELALSDDGNGPAWCAECGSLMRSTTPGRHQCLACERIESLMKTRLDYIYAA